MLLTARKKFVSLILAEYERKVELKHFNKDWLTDKMALLNTHTTVKKFMHFGAKEDLAEAIVEAINEQNNELATKADINSLKEATKADIAMLRTELKSEISTLYNKIETVENKIETVENNLENKIDAVENRLENKMDAVENRLENKMDAVENRLEAKIGLINSNIGWLKVLNLAILTTVLGIAFAPLAQNMFKAPAQEVIPSKK